MHIERILRYVNEIHLSYYYLLYKIKAWLNQIKGKLWFALTMFYYVISSVMHAFWLVLTYDLLEDRCIDDIIIKTFFNSLLYKVTHSAAPCVPLFCSYHILMSSVIYYWTDARQLGIYLLNWRHAASNP